MKKFLLFTLVVLTFAQAKAQGLEAYFSYGVFNIPGQKPYIETYLNITGRSINWSKIDDEVKSNIEITLVLWFDTTIISYSKEILQESIFDELGDFIRTAVVANPGGNAFKSDTITTNLTYLQRIEAVEGSLRIQVKLDDLNDTIKAIETGTFVDIDFPKDSTTISSIMAVESYQKSVKPNKTTKSGYDLVPNIFNYFPSKTEKFTFYSEIYPGENLKEGEPFLVVYYIKNHESDQILPAYKGFKRMTASKVNVLLNSFDIKGLASGNFDFVVEVRNSANILLSEKYYFFQRENSSVKMDITDVSSVNVANSFVESITNKDTLMLILRSMDPISSEIEKEFVKNLMKHGSIYNMQQYLLSFWEKRSKLVPEEPFKAYMQEVSNAELNFSTGINHGFETERGRVYLQYGPPNTIAKNYNEPSAYPYEIWHYYNLKDQRNRKFVFYNTDLSSNDFALLHSDAIGEPNNPQWRLQLRARDSNYKSIDQTGEETNDWGSRYNEWYSEPR